MKVTKLSYYYYLLTLSLPYCNNQQFFFVSSFLQGAHSNTAIRRHNHDTNTLNNAQAFLGSQQLYQIDKASSSPTQLYGFFDRFSRNRNDDDEDDEDDDNDEEETQKNTRKGNTSRSDGNMNEDNDSNDFDDGDISAMSESELEQAKESLENLFAIPNDNQKKSKRRKKRSSSSSSSSSSTPSFNLSSQIQSQDNSNNNEGDERSSNKPKDINEEQRETLLRTRDITLVSSAIPQPPLTAIARERRLKEISLISSLTHSDESVNELWALWISEKGPAAATLLLRAEQLMSVESYEEAETILWSLIRQHGIHWAEPVNRLATLKYMQGGLEESKRLCEVVLQTKPWHFGALSGIVLVCTAMNDAPSATMWAEKRLPPFVSERSPGDKRDIWIQNAIEDAKKSLNEASKIGRNFDIGQEEILFRSFRTQMQQLYLDDNSKESKQDSQVGGQSSLYDDSNLDAWQ